MKITIKGVQKYMKSPEFSGVQARDQRYSLVGYLIRNHGNFSMNAKLLISKKMKSLRRRIWSDLKAEHGAENVKKALTELKKLGLLSERGKLRPDTFERLPEGRRK